MAAISAEGIPCYSGSCSEIYREKAFERAGLAPLSPLPVAKQLGKTSLMFLVHPTLEESDLYDTCNAVDKVFRMASC
jgi:dTDP-4-amino-4,6-dideoxygalactose transaminase